MVFDWRKRFSMRRYFATSTDGFYTHFGNNRTQNGYTASRLYGRLFRFGRTKIMHEFQEFGALLWQALKPWFVNLGAAFVIYLVGLVIVFAKAKVQELKSDLLRSLITQGVYAAEQLYNSGDGKKKFEYVQQFLEDRRVYGVDKGLIESEVYWLSKHEKKQDATPAPLEAA